MLPMRAANAVYLLMAHTKTLISQLPSLIFPMSWISLDVDLQLNMELKRMQEGRGEGG